MTDLFKLLQTITDNFNKDDTMIDLDQINFFEELKELLKKHKAVIMWSNEFLIFTFKGNSAECYYQTASPLFAEESSNTFDEIEFVRTERVFHDNKNKESKT
jgi:phage FluMu gp28-like protein